MSDWKNLPEGVVTLVASHFPGPRPDAIRALRNICKPWSAEITAGITKGTLELWDILELGDLQEAAAPVYKVLQKTPRLRSLTVMSEGNASETLLLEIGILKPLVPELKSFVFYRCQLSNRRTALSEYLGENTTELEMLRCYIDICTIQNLHNLRHLTSLTVHMDESDDNDLKLSLCDEVFMCMPSLQVVCVTCVMIHLIGGSPDLPNLTWLSITDSEIRNPRSLLSGLTRLEHLDLNRTEFLSDLEVNDLPVSITSLKFCNLDYNPSLILANADWFSILASRLPLLSSLHIAEDIEVTDDVLAAIGRMPSLTRLSTVECYQITDTGLMNLVRSKLVWLKIQGCDQVTQQGVDALQAVVPRLEIEFS